MGMPTWWDERRFGVVFETSVAAVPAWAPIGEATASYRRHLGEYDGEYDGDGPASDGDDGPLVEVLAHHRDRWGHIERYDDFVALLDLTALDAEDWARLAVDAGAGYAAVVARHHDGWGWWDAPAPARSVATAGPCRNVVAEFAAACERNDLAVGVCYSALDDQGRSPTDEHLDTVVAPELDDLVARYRPAFIRIEPVGGVAIGSVADALGATLDDVVVDDRLGATPGSERGPGPVVRVFDEVPPSTVVHEPWELRAGIGIDRGHNRAERADHQATANEIVALLVETIAKGGHLLLSIGVDAAGAVPERHQRPLRAVGDWIRRHERLVRSGVPWTCWGDDEAIFVSVDDTLHLVDVGGRGHFSGLTVGDCPVESVRDDGESVRFRQDDDGLHLDLPRPAIGRQHRGAGVDIAVYELHLREVDVPSRLFDTSPRPPIALGALVRNAGAGTLVQLGDGVYTGPATIPQGVTVRGLGAGRTTIVVDEPLVLAETSRLEHVQVRSSTADRVAAPVVDIAGRGVVVLGCTLDGAITVAADDATIRATRLRALRATGVDRVAISRCEITGHPTTTGIDIRGGSRHQIDSCEIRGHRTAVRLRATTAAEVHGNDVAARRCGVHLEQTEDAHVHGNFVKRTMRGIGIDGGTHALVDGNAVCDGDSGCVVEGGAADCTIVGNTWERCRIGVLTWAVPDAIVHGNEAIALHEPDAALVVGP